MQPEHLREEIRQELFLYLCEMPDDKIIALHLTKSLKFYVTRMVLNMVQSSSSPFFKKYRKTILESIDGATEPRNSRFDDGSWNRVQFSTVLAAQSAEDAQQNMDREIQSDALISAVEKVLGNMHWYTRELFQLYVHHGSAGKVIEAMKKDLAGRYIPRRTILDVVKKAKTEIKNNPEVFRILAA